MQSYILELLFTLYFSTKHEAYNYTSRIVYRIIFKKNLPVEHINADMYTTAVALSSVSRAILK